MVENNKSYGDGNVSEVKAKVIVLLLFTNYYGI